MFTKADLERVGVILAYPGRRGLQRPGADRGHDNETCRARVKKQTDSEPEGGSRHVGEGAGAELSAVDDDVVMDNKTFGDLPESPSGPMELDIGQDVTASLWMSKTQPC